MATSERPLRYCDLCGGLDDHPRHVRSLERTEPNWSPSNEFVDGLKKAPASAMAQLMNPRIRVAHMDCCADAGCDICRETEAANGGKRGAALIDHLASTREK